MKQTIQYLEHLTGIASPTGYTKEIMNFVESTVTSFGYEAIRTAKGGILVSVKGKETKKQRFVTAHLDTLGAMVRAIKPDGRLKLALVGGFNYASIEGENCLVHLSNGSTVSGTILMHQTSVHVYANARTAERNQDNMEVRLDIKSSSKQETADYGIQVGDFISFDTRTTVTETGFIKSRHLDDKVSGAILLRFLEELAHSQNELPVTTHFYFSNNEEIGYGGNSNIPNEVVEYLAVDMGAMGDDQETDEYTVSICAKDSSGPYHYEFRKHLVELAKEHAIPYKIDIYPYYGSDASAAMKAGADVKHALIGAGIESSHAYERTHTDSILATKQLIEAYLFSGLVQE